MTDIKCVIGANFGDEGKGLMTDYFAWKAKFQEKRCLVILSNGGAQRGHTVRNPNGKCHVFRHLGSGTLVGAHTYLPKEYIVNPMIFRQERENLIDEWGIFPKILIHGDNLCSTPYDSMLNMMIEDNRGDKRHGSCGVGIWETIVRDGLRVNDLKRMSLESIRNYLRYICREYVTQRMKYLEMNITKEWKDILDLDMIIENYIDDLGYLIRNCRFVHDEESVFNSYDSIIFENGQGLLLDKDIEGYGEHTTPSNTGIKIPAKYIGKYGSNADVEVCYVTRSYMTRHGVGRFDSECKKDKINKYMLDTTNIENDYQGNLRYGFLDTDEMIERCESDFNSCRDMIGDAEMAVAVTHLDDYRNIDLRDKRIKYKCDSPFSSSVVLVNSMGM